MKRPARSELRSAFDGVRGVLRKVWNPVGAQGLPEDEYDSYAWPLVRLLREGAGEDGLIAHLLEVELSCFNRAGDRARLRRVAAALLALDLGRGAET